VMLIVDEAEYAWAIGKALLAVISGFSLVVYLAWMGSKKIFGGDEGRVNSQNTDSRRTHF
jgi:hypothetical protein